MQNKLITLDMHDFPGRTLQIQAQNMFIAVDSEGFPGLIPKPQLKIHAGGWKCWVNDLGL